MFASHEMRMWIVIELKNIVAQQTSLFLLYVIVVFSELHNTLCIYYDRIRQIINEQNIFKIPQNCNHYFPSGVCNFDFLWCPLTQFSKPAIKILFQKQNTDPMFNLLSPCSSQDHLFFFHSMSSSLCTAATISLCSRENKQGAQYVQTFLYIFSPKYM